jgi:hypothetical protein
MIRKYIPTALAAALAICTASTMARADELSPAAPADTKLTIKPAVLTTTADQGTPVSEVQYRRGYRRGWYSYPYRYRAYPYYGYSYRPYYSYYRPYYRPYYGDYYSYYRPYSSYYYPRYYTGYRGGVSFYGPRVGATIYW